MVVQHSVNAHRGKRGLFAAAALVVLLGLMAARPESGSELRFASGLSCPPARAQDAAPQQRDKEPSAEIAAVLVRSRTGRPIPGTVTVTGPEGVVRTAEAGPEGFLRVRLPVQREQYLLQFDSPGLLRRRLWVHLNRPGLEDLGRVTLAEPLSLDVEVVDEAGRPLGGASVQALSLDEPWRDDGSATVNSTATSGNDGRARLDGLCPSEFMLRVHAANFREGFLWVDALAEGISRKPVCVEMEAGYSVRARLVDDQGAPLPGLLVSTDAESTGNHLADMSRLRGTSDASGEVRWADLPPGERSVTLRLPDGTPELIHRFDPRDSRELTIPVPPRRCLRGRVVDAESGEPLAGVGVAVVRRNEAEDWSSWSDGISSGEDGSFTIADLPGPLPLAEGRTPLHVSLSFFQDGYQHLSWHERLREYLQDPGEAPRPDAFLEVRLERSPPVPLPSEPTVGGKPENRSWYGLEGTVRDVDGMAIPFARLEWVAAEGEWRDHLSLVEYADRSGRFVIQDTKQEHVKIRVESYGMHLTDAEPDFNHRSGHGFVEQSLSADTMTTVDFVLARDARMEGRVVLPDGSPEPGVVLTGLALDSHGRYLGQIHNIPPSAEDGSFHIDEAPDVPFLIVEAVSEDQGFWLPDADLSHRKDRIPVPEGGRVTGLVVSAVVPIVVEGRVFDPAGGPVEQGGIAFLPGRVENLEALTNFRLVTRALWDRPGDDGRFRNEDLHSGTWTPVACARGFRYSLGEPFEIMRGVRSGVRVPLVRGRAVFVEVRSMDGAPIEGATVYGFPPLPPFAGLRTFRRPPPTLIFAEEIGSTGIKGTCVLEGLRDLPYEVLATMDGYLAGTAQVGAGDSRVEIRLPRPGDWRGRVVDAEGNGLGGAGIHGRWNGPGSDAGDGPVMQALSLFGECDFSRSRGTGSADDGTFAIEDVAEGPFIIEVAKEGYLPETVSSNGEDAIVVLHRLEFIGGRVLGPVAPGARVRAVRVASAAGEGRPFRTPVGTAECDVDGQFLIRGLEEGEYRVSVVPEPTTRTVLHPANPAKVTHTGMAGLVLEAGAGQQLLGRLVDAEDGSPVCDGLRLEVRGTGVLVPAAPIRSVEPAPDGSFHVDGLAPGRYAVHVAPRKWGEETTFNRCREEFVVDTGDEEVVLPMRRGGQSEFSVEMPERLEFPLQWVAKVYVSGTGKFEEFEVEHSVDEGRPTVLWMGDNRFRAVHLDRSRAYDLEVRDLDSLRERRNEWAAVTTGFRVGTPVPNLRPTATRSIRGRVLDAMDRPCEYEMLSAWSRNAGGFLHFAETGEDGTFEISGLVDGDYCLSVEGMGEDRFPLGPVVMAVAGARDVVVRHAPQEVFRARFVRGDGKTADSTDYEVGIELELGGRRRTFLKPMPSGFEIEIPGPQSCRIRLQVIHIPTGRPGMVQGPFEVPGPSPTLDPDE